MAELKWYGSKVTEIVEAVAMKALHRGGEGILTEAIKEAPMLSGTLRRSGTVTIGGRPDPEKIYEAAKRGPVPANPSPLGDEHSVYVSFNTPYAAVQHEDMTLTHPIVGKAKYLEDPFKRNEENVLRLVEAEIKKALEENE